MPESISWVLTREGFGRHLSNVVFIFLWGGGGGGGGGTVCLFQLRPPIGNVNMIVLLFGFEDPLTERASQL